MAIFICMEALNKIRFRHWMPTDKQEYHPFVPSDWTAYRVENEIKIQWVDNAVEKNTVVNSDKRLYYRLVWEHTNRNAVHLANYNLRGFHNYHVDHIFPISKGFKEGILPSIIGGIDNLQMLPWRENFRKAARVVY